MRSRAHLPAAALTLAWIASSLFVPCALNAQQPAIVGTIAGRVWLQAHQPPSQSVLVSLLHRGAPIDSVYTDSQGGFGFHNLSPDVYLVSVEDSLYQPVHETVVIEAHATSPVARIDITLVPKNPDKAASQSLARPGGSNPRIADVREYSEHFPRDAVKEFEKGVKSDNQGKKDDALKHYLQALKIAPDFYPAHNNLGSDYLSKANLAAARAQFEQVVQLNQSDAEGYFNLSNVCMLQSDLNCAETNLDHGMQRQPDSAFGQFLRGSLDMRTGRYQQAEAALRKAIELNPLLTQARLQLVNLFLQHGRKFDAQTELQAFLQAFPNDAFAPKARQLLQKLENSSGDAHSGPVRTQ